VRSSGVSSSALAVVAAATFCLGLIHKDPAWGQAGEAPAGKPVPATYSFDLFHKEKVCTPGFGCNTTTHTTSYTASASLKPVDGGYEGFAVGPYKDAEDSNGDPIVGCPQGSDSHVVTYGQARMTLRVQFSIDNDVVGGIDTSQFDREVSVVEVMVEGENLPWTQSGQECGEARNDSRDGIAGFDCHFYDVDLEHGGTFKAFKDGDPDAGTCTLQIGPAQVELRIHGTVTGVVTGDGGGKKPLPLSRVVAGEVEQLPMPALSTSKPAFTDETLTSDDGKGSYELTLKIGPDRELPKVLVVSLLWYRGRPEYAVTAAGEPGDVQTPIYQALCVDDDPSSSCAKWQEAGGGNYEAEVDFEHGSAKKLNDHKTIMAEEYWDGGQDTKEEMLDAAFIYYHAWRALKYFVSQGLPLRWDPLMIRIYLHVYVHGSPCIMDNTSAYYDSPALADKKFPSFGDLGLHLDAKQATGSGVYFCIENELRGSYEPAYGLWHELGHYLQYQMYDPEVLPQGANHQGYSNETSNDSIIEGFATFAAMLTKEHYGDPAPYVFAWENLELDYKVWGELLGVWAPAETYTWGEEDAVSGILWDLHDAGKEINLGQNIDGTLVPLSKVYPVSVDEVSLDDHAILNFMATTKPKTLEELYDDLVNIMPIPEQDVDMIFLNHGVFADVVERNYVQDSTAEPIGPTGSSEDPVRPVRQSPKPRLPGSNLLSTVDATYLVTVHFAAPYQAYDYEYRFDAKADTPIPFEMAPQYYPSTATFTRLSEDDKPLPGATEIDSADYWKYMLTNPAADAVYRTLQ